MQVVTRGTTKLIAVRTGMFADGLVEVSGNGNPTKFRLLGEIGAMA